MGALFSLLVRREDSPNPIQNLSERMNRFLDRDHSRVPANVRSGSSNVVLLVILNHAIGVFSRLARDQAEHGEVAN